MCDLLPDSWQEETQIATGTGLLAVGTSSLVMKGTRVQDTGLWIEHFLRMAAILVSCYCDKAPRCSHIRHLFVRASWNFEGNV